MRIIPVLADVIVSAVFISSITDSHHKWAHNILRLHNFETMDFDASRPTAIGPIIAIASVS